VPDRNLDAAPYCALGSDAKRGDTPFKSFIALCTLFVCLVSCGVGGNPLGISAVPTNNILVPTPVATNLRFTALAVGLQHACGLTSSGILYCWGDNSYQQLGTLTTLPTCQILDGPCSPTPLVVAGGSRYVKVAASLRDTCALTASGEAWCWGFGQGGQLGNGQVTNSSVPVLVSAASPLSAIALGGSGLLACAIGLDGAGYCWGPDGYGGLGNGSTVGSDTPVSVSGGLAFASLSVGDDHACGVTTKDVGYCWGDNEYGDLGNGAAGPSSVPGPVTGGLNFSMLSAGLAHTCGLTMDGIAYCWGFPPAIGSAPIPNMPTDSPIPVSGGRHFTTISAGENFTCALDGTGAAWCWGQNEGGSLGNGTMTDSAEPVPVNTSARFVAIWAGGSVCALDAAGQAYCWGPNGAGQAGQPL
jgi:alpha-tubulin suppressor-like RCC1 family protein